MTLDKAASYLNKFRVIPRTLVIASAIYLGIYIWEVTEWYMLLEVHTAEASAFAASVTTLLGTIFKFIYDKYVETGKTE